MSKPKVIAVVGPTASGKSTIGEYLAKKLHGEVISADSRQVYRAMRVISRSEPGHMVGIADPKKQFSAGEFANRARSVVDRLLTQQKVPIVVGGTGFYAEALLYSILPEVPSNPKLRATLNKKTVAQLQAQLRKLDSISAKRVDPHNKVRLVRAIEIAKALGKVPVLQNTKPYRTLWLGILPVASTYTNKLRKGVEERLRRGMVAEAKRLRAILPNKRYAELGFEFALLVDYLDKKTTKQELIEQLVRGELQYAKRQMKWFRRNKEIVWVVNKEEALKLAKRFIM